MNISKLNKGLKVILSIIISSKLITALAICDISGIWSVQKKTVWYSSVNGFLLSICVNVVSPAPIQHP